MDIKKAYKVVPIKNFECNDWLLHKHYAKRIPSISYAFGLIIDNVLNGVCTFGFPANYNYNNGKCIFNDYSCLTLELNRLVVNDNLPANSLSYFVSRCLKMLPSPCCIVSYADPNNGHNGYIYQATNWIYTGASSIEKIYFLENGEAVKTRRHIDKKGVVVRTEKQLPKNRYIYFIGSKKDVRKMKKEFKMNIYPYPKGDNTKYDASYTPVSQKKLF